MEPVVAVDPIRLKINTLPLHYAALDQCIIDLEQVTNAEQIAELATQVKILGIQLQSINSAISMAVNDVRATLVALSTTYEAHYNQMSGGMDQLGDVAGHPRVLLVEE